MRRGLWGGVLTLALAAGTTTGAPVAIAAGGHGDPAAGRTLIDASAAGDRSAGDLSATGTLLYIKDHNLWMARGNGTDAVQLTDDGTASAPYSSPSMADNGRFAVAQGEQFGVFEPDGTPVAIWKPEQLFLDSKGGVMPKPFDPVLSPDGTKVAYSQVRTYSSGGKFVTEGLLGITPLAPGVIDEIVVSAGDPAWLSNGRLMLRRGSIHLHDVGSRTEPTEWFEAEDYHELDDFSWSELGDPVLSPDGRTIMVTGFSGNQLHWIKVVGDPSTSIPPPPSELVCALSEQQDVPDGFLSHYESPDFGPENDAAVYEQYGDLYRIDNIAACDGTTTITEIVPGGSDPEWSPVAYAPPTGGGTTPPPGGGGTTPPPGGGGTTPPGGAGAKAKITLKGKGKLALTGKARVGKKLKVKLRATKPRKTTKKFTWFRNGKKIKGANKRVLKLTRKDRGKKITAKVVLKAKGHKRLVVRTKVVRVR